VHCIWTGACAYDCVKRRGAYWIRISWKKR
jgi:hypothetical protein